MAIEGAYEEGGLVVIESDNAEPVRLTWRKAMEHCRAVAEMEQSVSMGRRTPGIQKAIEQIIAAAREARKKTEADWKPPTSVSMYQQGSRDELRRKRIARSAGAGNVTPGGIVLP